MLYKTLDRWQLQKEFKECNRDYYSLDGYQAILDLFEELDSNQELDAIAICCDFTESDFDEIRSEYDLVEEEFEDDDKVMDYLNYRTWAMQLDNGTVLYQNF